MFCLFESHMQFKSFVKYVPSVNKAFRRIISITITIKTKKRSELFFRSSLKFNYQSKHIGLNMLYI